ncbi:uncharacterized protein LOC124995414 [Mugil cephalus]|uniref:uncharacterized protein LOC124995414 n=1 Tax=Mugil cephalus TaxID=48193 RepID=UPI001FB5906B|nr:uncharacterized protein LOC124995414 [Mugil cephalus]
MGNCCCGSQSPCGSAEESRGLLNDEQKATVGTSEPVVVGTCATEEENDMRRNTEDNREKQSAEKGESSNTQGNGPLQEESIRNKTTPHEVSENGTRAQNKDETPAHSGQAEQAELLHCTLNSLPKVGWLDAKPEEENPASEKDRNPGGCLPTAELVCADNRTDTNTEHTTVSATLHDHEEEEEEKAPTAVTVYNVAAKPSEETAQNNEVLSAPNAQLAEAADPMSSIFVVREETKTEPQSCPVTDNSDGSRSPVCREVDPADVNSRDVSQSSPGLEPNEPVHSREEWSASDVQQPQTTAPADASESSDLTPESDPKRTTATLREVTSFKPDVGEEEKPNVQDKEEDVPGVKENDGMKVAEVEKGEVASAPTEAEAESGKDAEIREMGEKQEEPPGSPVTGGKAESEPAAEGEEDLDNSEEDLYRGAEELSACHSDEPEPLSESETKCLKLEDRCSLDPAVDILYYSEREWKGNTAKSALIKKGYKEMSQRFGSVRRVRGDNYCALRATLFQVLSHTTKLPVWLQDDIVMLPKQLEAQEGLISQWTFPGECLQGDGTGDAAQQLKSYMELLRNKWQAAVDCGSTAERQQLCEQLFLGGEEELGLLEALKLLMLARAVELHGCMQSGEDVPLFCWLLFARDSSDCPQSFLSNHLSHVGLTAGLEQVEMFLLGYALQCTIQVYRLYKADTEEFVTYYPDDHKDDWESVCLVTEDDRHYNVPVAEAAELHKETPSS